MTVLDDMTKGIAGLDQLTKEAATRKGKAAGPKLTPVGAEASPTKPSQVGIPDMAEPFLANETVTAMAKDIRKQSAYLVAVADALDLITGESTVAAPEDPKKVAAAATKVAEAEGDAKAKARKLTATTTPDEFAAHQAALAAEAQASAFASLDDIAEDILPEVPVTNVDGWVCPEHGDAAINSLTSRKGRTYRACGACKQFEKE